MNTDFQMTTTKFYLYARVSSREQESEGYSLDAQLKSCRDYATANDFEIVEEFIDIESAKELGRKNFGRMLDFLRENPNVGILVEKVDRLYRNWRDYVTLDDLKIELIFVKDNITANANSRSSDKLMLGMRVLMARNYIDNLSDEIKKGLYEKFIQGGYPRKAPLGYLNDKSERTIVIDPIGSKYVIKFFEWYATGNYTLQQMADILYGDGLRTRTGEKVIKSSLHRIIQDPFYYGIMKYNGRVNKGNHNPLVSKRLFDQAGEMLKNRGKPKGTKHNFALKGTLKCFSCACAITAETKRDHVYYRCTHSKPCPEKKYVREEVLSEEIDHILSDLEMDSEFVSILIKATKESKQEELNYNLTSVGNLNSQLEHIKKKLSKLVDAHIDSKIPEDLYDIKREELLKEKSEIESQLGNHNNAHDSTFEQLEKVLKVAKVAQKLFKVGDSQTKQALLSMLSSNILLHDGKIASYQLNPLFSYLFKRVKLPEKLELSGRGAHN